jgi:phospholipase/carboxylesterase
MHKKNIITAGKELTASGKVLILLHGRGGSAEDILSLAQHFDVSGFTLLAPQATNNTWYPLSFLAPPVQNEPWLSSALIMLKEVVDEVKLKGVQTSSIYFAGFSQGACLMLEFITRNASRYGGAVAFTGGLIGDKINNANYSGDFEGTPIFIGSSNPDPHVPVERVYATSNILRSMNALVTEKIYDGMGHTINQDEVDNANKIVFSSNTVNS